MRFLDNPLGALRAVSAAAGVGPSDGPGRVPGTEHPGPRVPGPGDPGPPRGPTDGGTPGKDEANRCKECEAQPPVYMCKPGTDECQQYDFECRYEGGEYKCVAVPGAVVDDKYCTPRCKPTTKLPE